MSNADGKIAKLFFPYISSLLIFVFVFIFFTYVHPVTIFDGDDWRYIATFRKPFPIWGHWNPARVLPEVLLPLVGYLSAYFINLFVHDYIFSLTVTAALLIALTTVVLYLVFVQYLKGMSGGAGGFACILGLWLVIAHFGFFKSQDSDNVYLLFATNFICFFYYVIPNLGNSILVLYLAGKDDFDSYFMELSRLKQGLFICWLYFAVFSNLFCSAILAVFCFSKLCLSWVKNKGTFLLSWRKTLSSNRVCAYTLLLWLVSVVFETQGERASVIGKTSSYLQLPLAKTLSEFFTLGRSINREWLILLVFCFLTAIIIYLRSKQSDISDVDYKTPVQEFLLSGVFLGIFLIMLCAKVQPYYANRIQSVYGFYFYLIVLFFIAVVYVLEHIPKVCRLLPLLTVFMLVVATSSGQPFQEATVGNHVPKVCKAVDEDLIKQVQEADKLKKKEMVLKVPKGDDIDNWPHPNYVGDNISRALFAHGLITRKIEVKIVPDPSMNQKYYR